MRDVECAGDWVDLLDKMRAFFCIIVVFGVAYWE